MRFRALVENSSDAILLVDRRGICTYASPSIERILGYHPEDLENSNIFITAYPELYHRLLAEDTLQFCSLKPNSHRGKRAVMAHPIADNEGVLGDLWLANLPQYCFSEQDARFVRQVANQCAIALRQSRLYQAAQAQVKELERLNQLKDDFLSTVSHELRAPMANIKMSCQMLAIQLKSLNIDPTSPANRYIHILEDECNREISLINDLLDLARLDADTGELEFTCIHLQQHLSVLTASFQERMQNHHQHLILDIPPDLPPILSHEKYFNRICVELLNNACKYTPPHEHIIVSATMMVPANGMPPDHGMPPDDEAWEQSAIARPDASLPHDRGDRHIQLRVTNTGVEISSDECDRIFDKFYRIPNNDPWRHGGTGLGLALVKKLVDLVGSNIQVESEHQQTSFLLTFALQNQPHQMPKSRRAR